MKFAAKVSVGKILLPRLVWRKQCFNLLLESFAIILVRRPLVIFLYMEHIIPYKFFYKREPLENFDTSTGFRENGAQTQISSLKTSRQFLAYISLTRPLVVFLCMKQIIPYGILYKRLPTENFDTSAGFRIVALKFKKAVSKRVVSTF